MNVPKVKGTHNAMKTGMLAAENAFEALSKGQRESETETKGQLIRVGRLFYMTGCDCALRALSGPV